MTTAGRQMADMTTKVTISLHRDVDTNEWFVDKLEAVRGNMRSLNSFFVPVPLRNAFVADFASFLLMRLPKDIGLSVTGFERHALADSALVLMRIRIIAQRAFAGIQSVVIRIAEARGDLLDLFLVTQRMDMLALASGAPAELQDRSTDPDSARPDTSGTDSLPPNATDGEAGDP
ncbi:hypothetical protein [Salipiger pallidus]|nr:hypothetical protein [Salipiger pallidus]